MLCWLDVQELHEVACVCVTKDVKQYKESSTRSTMHPCQVLRADIDCMYELVDTVATIRSPVPMGNLTNPEARGLS
jgi:hypothetical protein